MNPRVAREPAAFRAACDAARAEGRRVAFVPTMGALHDGHLALVAEARRRVGDEGLVAVSIFVNPTQFGPNEDLSRYPRDLDGDLARCEAAGVDVVFAPSPEAMYPPGEQTRVRVTELTGPLCGDFRPGHFEGVTTVVARLFCLAGPCVAVFGRKDYQQWRVVERMARDLFMPVEVVGHPTVRERDGLAMSSRNRYLSPVDRERARAVPRALATAARRWERGSRDPSVLRDVAARELDASVDTVEYVELRDPVTLLPLEGELRDDDRALLAVAVRVGGTRLIDNVVLGEERGPA